MINYSGSFPYIYYNVGQELRHYPTINEPRGLPIVYELNPVYLSIMAREGALCFSHPKHRVTPIRFVLAELLWILSGSNDAKMIAQYNKQMIHFSDDGITLYGAYGKRLDTQIETCIHMLLDDIDTRRAVAVIYDKTDLQAKTKDIPCNVLLQFMVRNNCLDLYVVSRSSDYVTGLSIDGMHWQLLLMLVANELRHHGSNVEYGSVHYVIHSLHVYERDKDMFDNWKDITWNRMDERNIYVSGRYTKVKEEAERCFNGKMSLVDLMNMLTVSEISRSHIHVLAELFTQHRNSCVR